MLSKLSSAALLCGLALAVGCGDDDNEKSAQKPVTTDKQEAAAGLEKFVLVRGEEPGYAPDDGPVQKVTSVAEFAEFAQTTEARLRQRGFVAFVAHPLEGKSDAAGITNVAVYKDAAGAKADLTEQERDLESDFPGAKRFDVPGIPGGMGWTAKPPDEPGVANIAWIEGRCAMTLGNQGEGSLVGPLTTGAQAVHKRVAGSCP